MNEHTGFHEDKHGVRFNPDCPVCQTGGGDYTLLFGELLALAKDRNQKQQQFEEALKKLRIIWEDKK